MLRAQMRGLRDTFVVSTEEDFPYFEKAETDAANIVIKRNARTYKGLHNLPEDIRLIYLVRHPYDTLTSHHPGAAQKRRFHIPPERWVGEFEGLKRLEAEQPARDILIVRYEDVVTDPTGTQQRIGDFLGLPFEKPFGTVRRVVPNSLYKWRMYPDRVQYLSDLPTEMRPLLDEFCERFGYDGKLSLAPFHSLLRLRRNIRQRWFTRPQDVQWGES